MKTSNEHFSLSDRRNSSLYFSKGDQFLFWQLHLAVNDQLYKKNKQTKKWVPVALKKKRHKETKKAAF
jgi:hypothetical protein